MIDKRLALSGLNFILLIALSFYVFLHGSQKTYVYVDNDRLFAGFAMSQDIEKLARAGITKRQTTIDSIYTQISISEEKQFLVKALAQKQSDLDDFRKRYAYEESDKVWERIFDYTKDFSVIRNYKIVIGYQKRTAGILHADPQYDVTDELLKYINQRYAGVN